VDKYLRLLLLSCLVVELLGSGIACQSTPQQYTWRMATSWTSDNLFFTQAARPICDRVKTLSGGRLVIQPYPAGEVTGPLEVMEAVSTGKVEIGHSWSGYWTGKDRTFELFSSIPNQMVAQEWLVWLYGPSQGIAMWKELYAQYNIVPFPGGLVGPEFGFFTNKPVRTLEDFKGLKLRVSGLASDVMKELGATTILTAPGDIKAAMQKGEIDGFEFSTPAIDWPMGFQEVAPYVSLPSWHQPSAMFETIVNRDAYNKLPADLQAILESACKEIAAVDFFAGLEGSNAEYLSRFEQYGTQIDVLDKAAVRKISEITDRLADEQAARSPSYARVLTSQRQFVTAYRGWETWGNPDLYSSQNDAGKVLSMARQNLIGEMSILEKDMALAARKLSGLDMSGDAARPVLSGLLQNRPYVVDVCTVGLNGKIMVVEPAAYREFEGYDISDQEQVTRLLRTQKPVLSWNFRAVEGFEASDLEYPVISSNNRLMGAVSVLLKPEILLDDIVTAAVKNTDCAIWAMQPDGRIIYDVDSAEIGRNLFSDPLYQPYPELLALGKEISSAKAGTGQYQFLDTGLQKTVTKAARWDTFELNGAEWRLVLITVIP